MSQVYTDYGVVYDIYAGVTKTFTSVPIDPNTNQAADLSSTSTYATGYVDITQADGTIITSNVAITYVNRTAGTSNVSWTVGPFTNTQAGNWMGFLYFKNSGGAIIDSIQFNFIIREAY